MNRSQFPLEPSLAAKIEACQVKTPLGFGEQIAPVVAYSSYENGKWSAVQMRDLDTIQFSPLITGLHYGQLIFEGMKAFSPGGKGPFLFRPQKSAERFNRSAARMAMAEVPEQLFTDSVFSLVHCLKDKIPQGPEESLYIRPLMFASEEGFFLRPSQKYVFIVMASPCAGYFSSSKVSALIDREDCRAAPGGTGGVKVAGNYGGSFRSSVKAKSLGFQQTLWLDALEKKYIEEFSGMNFFAVIDGVLHTPSLSETILPGITRDAVIQIGRSLGFRVEESRLEVSSLIKAIREKRCTEVFACGTAAVICPVSSLGEADGTLYHLPEVESQKVWQTLREVLTGVQNGSCEDRWGFRVSLQEQGAGHP